MDMTHKNDSATHDQLLDRLIQQYYVSLPDNSWEKTYATNRAHRFLRDVSDVLEHIDSGRVLDCGAAPYLSTKMFESLGFDVTAVDIAPERSDVLKHMDLHVVKQDLDTEEPLPFGDGSFDVILFNEIFEHLRGNLINTAKELHRILAPNGYLFLSTPNSHSLRGRIKYNCFGNAYSCADNLYDEWDKLEKLGHMGHVREYSVNELVDFVGKCGFTVWDIKIRNTKHPKNIKQKIYNGLTVLTPKLRNNIHIVLQR
jgi:SAM-dependent methyltransferase